MTNHDAREEAEEYNLNDPIFAPACDDCGSTGRCKPGCGAPEGWEPEPGAEVWDNPPARKHRTCLGCEGEGRVVTRYLGLAEVGWQPCPACLGSGTVTEPKDTSALDEDQAMLVYNEWAEANPFDAF